VKSHKERAMQHRPDATDVRRSSAYGDGGELEQRRIAVALQGGGSHGAFTWGVLDRLLEEPISGTSAAQ
jgi:predicted acylesterase/phospholipase RssA